MKNTSRWKDVLLVMGLVGGLAVFLHFWISSPRGVMRAIFPLEALVAGAESRCSTNAPEWMLSALTAMRWQGHSLANQLAYVAPNGQTFHCESGWTQALLTSPPVSVASRYRYASLTKLFTADAVLGLVHDGKLRLGTTLKDVFPELFPAKDARLKKVTVAMLLQHEGGFDRLQSIDPVFERGNKRPWCPYQLEKLRSLMLDFDPGSRQSYSNLGYCLLGKIIARVSASPYRDYMEAHYDLAAADMRFIDGPYLPDEVRYDFRFEPFWMPNYYRSFNIKAGAAAGGLSGNALALALKVMEMLQRQPPNLVSGKTPKNCGMDKLMHCFIFGFGQYQAKGWNSFLFVKGGYFPAATSFAVVDAAGGVTVMLMAGSTEDVGKKDLLEVLHQGLKN